MKITSKLLRRIILEEIENAKLQRLIREFMAADPAAPAGTGKPLASEDPLLAQVQNALTAKGKTQMWVIANEKIINQIAAAAKAVAGKLGIKKAAEDAVNMFLKNSPVKETVEARLRRVVREAMALDPQISANIDRFVARQAPPAAVGDDAVRGQVEAELGKQLGTLGMDRAAAMKWIMDPKNERVIQMITTNTEMSGDAKKEVEKFVKNVATGASMKESRRRIARRKSK
jgi:hypothetical protein